MNTKEIVKKARFEAKRNNDNATKIECIDHNPDNYTLTEIICACEDCFAYFETKQEFFSWFEDMLRLKLKGKIGFSFHALDFPRSLDGSFGCGYKIVIYCKDHQLWIDRTNLSYIYVKQDNYMHIPNFDDVTKIAEILNNEFEDAIFDVRYMKGKYKDPEEIFSSTNIKKEQLFE